MKIQIPGLAAVTCALALAIAGTLPLGAASKTNQQVFVAGFYPEPIEWNPLKTYSALEAQLYTAVYEGLVTYNPSNLRPAPGVAVSWDISADKLKYRFHLRPDAKYWDGTAVDAANFRNTWLRLIDPATESPFAGLLDSVKGVKDFRTGQTKDPSKVGIRVVDPLTLDIELIQPTPYFLQILCHQSLVPIHPSLLAKADWDADKDLIGNGPFRIESMQKDAIVLKPAATYWDRASVKIDELDLELKDDADAYADAYNNGDIQWVDSSANYDKIQDVSAMKITPQFSTSFLYFSNSKAAYRNPSVRKALTLLLPLEDIRSKDYYIVPTAQLVPEIPGYPKPDTVEKQDVPAAMKLLSDAGFPNGKGLPPIVVRFQKSEAADRIGKMMQDAWKPLDVKVDVQQIDSDTYYDNLKPEDFTIASISWVGDYADPMTFLDMWSSASNLNRSGFSNADYDKLLLDSNSLQAADRYKSLSKAESILLQGAQVIPISNTPAFNALDLDRVDGWFENPLNIHPFKYFALKAAKPPRNIAGL